MKVKRFRVFSFVMAAVMVMTLSSALVPDGGYREVYALRGGTLEGQGTEDKPYRIKSYEDLKAFADIVNNDANAKHNKAACAVLVNDIDAGSSASANDWEPIGNSSNYYTGVFDGKGYTIYRLTVNLPDRRFVGLFGIVGDGGGAGTVKNVSLEGGSITGKDDVGGIAGSVIAGTISNCHNANDLTGTETGINDLELGGVAGYVDGGTINNCGNTGTVTLPDNSRIAGGVAGYFNGTMADCYNTGDILGTGAITLGGIAGLITHSDVRYCYNAGNVTGKEFVGGIIGSSSSSIVTYTYNTGEATGNQRVGGVMGYTSNSTLTNSYNSGKVYGNDATSSMIGGITGHMNEYSRCQDCYNRGEIEGNNQLGGIAGHIDMEDYTYVSCVTRCYSSGSITVKGSSPNKYGGVIGYLKCDLNLDEGSYSFFDTDKAGINNTVGYIEGEGSFPEELGKSTAELRGLHCTTYTTWDFDKVWRLTDGYPVLRFFDRNLFDFRDDIDLDYNGEITYTGGVDLQRATLTVPYKVSVKGNSSVNGISYLITNKPYDAKDAEIKAYGKADDYTAATGRATITLPDDFNTNNDRIYLIAEHAKEDNTIDAGKPLAVYPYDLWVGGTPVSFIHHSGKGTGNNPGSWSYDRGSNTLTLNGLQESGAGYGIFGQATAMIWYEDYRPLNIAVNGNNVITQQGNTTRYDSCGIYIGQRAGKVTLSGSGSLDLKVKGTTTNLNVYGIGSNSENALEIKGPKVNITTRSGRTDNAYERDGISIPGTLSITGSKVSVDCQVNEGETCSGSRGLVANEILIDKSTVSAVACGIANTGSNLDCSSLGLGAYRISIKDSTVDATGGNISSSNGCVSYGICARDNVTSESAVKASFIIKNSKVTASGGNVKCTGGEGFSGGILALSVTVNQANLATHPALYIASGELTAKGGPVSGKDVYSYGIHAIRGNLISTGQYDHRGDEVLISPDVSNLTVFGHTAAFGGKSIEDGKSKVNAALVASDGAGVVLSADGWTDYEGKTGKSAFEITNDATAAYNALKAFKRVSYQAGEPGPTPPTPTRVEVESLALDVSSVKLECGQTYSLKTTFNPSNATDKSLTWKTGNKKVASVSADGTVTGVGKGTTTITAISSNGKTATCKVKVKEYNDIKRVYITPAGIILKAGKTKTVRAIILPTKAKNKRVTWKSSNPKVATVAPVSINKAKITAVKKGTAKITVTTADSKKKRTIKVTVKAEKKK